MTHPSLPEPIALPDTQSPSPPAEPVPVALHEIPEPAPAKAALLPAILAAADDRYYSHHWGINE